VANTNLGNGNLRPETFGKTSQELPLRIAGPPLRPVLGEASYGNVVLSCGEGKLRGFEPLTSAVQAPARLTGSSLPFLGGSSATSATAGAGISPTRVPAPCVASASNVSPVSTRTAWLPVAASKRRTITST
jgi:hypothetical protein